MWYIMSKINYFDYLQILHKEKRITDTSKEVIDDYLLDLKLSKIKEKTIENYLKVMIFVMLNVETDVNKFTPRDIKIFQQKLQDYKKYADATQKLYTICFKHFLKWYSRNINYNNRQQYTQLLADAFVEQKYNIPEKTPADLLTEHEIVKIIDKGCKNARDKALIAVLAESGCRIGELVGCKVKDLVFNDKSCNLTFPKGKTGMRTVTIVFATSYLVQYLNNHPTVNTPNFKESPLFTTDRKRSSEHQFKQLEPNTVRYIMKQAAKRVDIKKRIYPHLFRHTRATQLSKKLKEVQMREYLGWSRHSDMPSYYAHISAQDMTDAIHEMHGIVDVKEDETGMKVGFCRNCKKPIPVESKICNYCNTLVGINEKEELVNTVIAELGKLFKKDNSWKKILNMRYEDEIRRLD
jgi:integrase/recombinase XerD